MLKMGVYRSLRITLVVTWIIAATVNSQLVVQDNARISGGNRDYLANSLYKCLTTCAGISGCSAIDFIAGFRECYLHMGNAVCSPAAYNFGSTNIVLRACQTPASTPSAVIPDQVAYPRSSVVIRRFGLDFKTCLDECVRTSGCAGIDYHPDDAACYLNTDRNAECNLQSSQGWTHLTIVPCPTSLPAPVAAPVPPPVVPIPVPVPAPVPVPIPVPASAVTNPNTCDPNIERINRGSMYQNDNLYGGREVTSARTFIDCWNACFTDPLGDCWGIDFDKNRNPPGCFLHGRQQVCSGRGYLPGNTLYRWTDCPSKPFYQTVTVGYTALPTFSAVPATFEQCLGACFSDANCVGFDYNAVGGMCSINRDSATECDNLYQYNPGWDHVSFTQCNACPPGAAGGQTPPRPRTTTTTTTRRPTTTTTRAPPAPSPSTGCDSSVQRFTKGSISPGEHMYGGRQIVSSRTFMDCWNACYSDQDCYAIDYDRRNNPPACFTHSRATSCSEKNILRTNTLYQWVDCANNEFYQKVTTGWTALPPANAVRANFEQCVSSCYSDSNCVGIDYHSARELCTINTNTALECENRFQINEGWDHLSLSECNACKSTSSPSPVPVGLNGCEIDLMFVVDGSGSICDDNENLINIGCSNFYYELEFAEKLSKELQINGNSGDRVGMTIFGDRNHEKFGLTAHSTNDQVQQAIRSLRVSQRDYPGGWSNLPESLNHIKNQMFTSRNNRYNAYRVILIISDGNPAKGRPEWPEEVVRAAEELKQDGVYIIAVAVGTSIDFQLMGSIISHDRGSARSWHVVQMFSELDSLLPALQNIGRNCDGYVRPTLPPPPPPVPVRQDGCSIDLVIVIDESGSICDKDQSYDQTITHGDCSYYRRQLQFAKDLIAKFPKIGPDGTVVSAVGVANQGRLLFSFLSSFSRTYVTDRIESIRFGGQETNIKKKKVPTATLR